MYRNIRNICFIVAAILLATNLYAQSTFETLVPREAVISGESFRVQYVVKNATQVEQFKAPAYKNFRIISGPDIYKGSTVGKNGLEYMTNIIFTMVAMEEGRYLIRGASALIDGALKKSNDVYINVTTKELQNLSGKNVEVDSFPSDFYIGTDENVMEKIRRNLFLRVSVNKKTSYVGEPIVAEFKLYSRLESRSEIIKNPGFYGFGVHDIIGLGDKVSTTEIIDGKPFDVHTVRKVQLYALQPGNFTIDAMELDNRVEFNMQNLEENNQEIVENMYGDQLNLGKEDYIETFEMALRTPPVEIKIKPLPTEGVTSNFNGAVGKFNITGKIDNDNLKKNQEGKLVITIRGAGNISQIGAPQVQWPVELENFEPASQENFDRHQVPLFGTKTFEYAFVGNKPGDYIIAPVEFAYFNLNSGKYETIKTLPFSIKITNETFGGAFAEINKNTGNNTSLDNLKKWLLVIGGLVLLSLLGVYLFKRKKGIPAVKEPANDEALLSVPDILKPAKETMDRNDPVFYNKLKDATWVYLSDRLGITGSNQNKEVLKLTMEEKGAGPALINDIQELLKQCELHIYTGAASANDETFLFSQVETFMYKCDLLLGKS